MTRKLRAGGSTLGLIVTTTLLIVSSVCPALTNDEQIKAESFWTTVTDYVPPPESAAAQSGGEIFSTGPMDHLVSPVEILDAIPADRTIEQFKTIAESKPAPDGMVWYLIAGSTTNNSDQERSFKGSFVVVDESGNEYEADYSTSQFYIDERYSMLATAVAPGQTRQWKAYFPVSKHAQYSSLRVDDLTFLGEFTALVPLNEAASESSSGGDSGDPAPPPRAAVPLEQIADSTMGYSIYIPQGAQTLRKGEYAHTFSKVMPDGLFEYNVNLTPLGVADMEEAVSTATLAGGIDVEESVSVNGGYLVVKAPRGPLQEVWIFRAGSTKSVTAKCTGPASTIDDLRTICESLQVE